MNDVAVTNIKFNLSKGKGFASLHFFNTMDHWIFSADLFVWLCPGTILLGNRRRPLQLSAQHLTWTDQNQFQSHFLFRSNVFPWWLKLESTPKKHEHWISLANMQTKIKFCGLTSIFFSVPYFMWFEDLVLPGPKITWTKLMNWAWTTIVNFLLFFSPSLWEIFHYGQFLECVNIKYEFHKIGWIYIFTVYTYVTGQSKDSAVFCLLNIFCSRTLLWNLCLKC